MNRKLVMQIGVVVCGCALGAGVAYGIERAIQLKEGRTQLLDYAQRLVHIGDQLGAEDTAAIAAVVHDNLGFCSEQELEFMRDFVFRAPHIRDMGRTKDGRLVCTSGIGRLSEPKVMPVPNIASGNVNIYVGIPLIITKRTTGFVVEQDGVSIVLSPASIEHYVEPPKYYSTALYDRLSHRLIHTSGPEMPLSDAEVVAGRLIERNGSFYQPLCSPSSMVCRIAAESRRDMLAGRGPLFAGFLMASAFLGGAITLIAIQFYLGQRAMESQLRRAIRKGSLTLVYQPIVDLETGGTVGAEALVRWIDEEGESVRPEVFISLAEERGFVGEITCWMVQRTAEELGDLLANGELQVSLNITSEDLTDPVFFACLARCMEAAGVKPSSIGLEITERSTADKKTAVEALARLKSAGHMVYIDDFGTGYSSLAYLHRLHVDAIKVDRAFTQTVGTGAVTASVVPQILEMAAQLDLLVVVEGIETKEQAEYFRAAGRGILGQGWLFGKPVPAAQFRKLLKDAVG